MGKWGNGEVGEWGSGGIQLKPENPKTRKPENPKTLTPNTCPLLGHLENKSHFVPFTEGNAIASPETMTIAGG